MNEKRIERLCRLHAKALGMYMARRANGEAATIQRKRMERITQALLKELEVKNEDD